MAIVTPGKRPGDRIAASKVFGKKFGRGKKVGYASLMLTSLVDMFTIIVIFLLMNFSANGGHPVSSFQSSPIVSSTSPPTAAIK